MDGLPGAPDLSAGGPLRLTGPGLVLREWTEDDLPVMVELFDDPAVARRTPLPTPFTAVEARARLGWARQPDRLVLAVTADGVTPVGEVLLTATGELGYLVGARHRGRGHAGRALALLVDHAHDALGLPILGLRIEPDNGASVAVARRCGFSLAEAAAEVVENKGRRCVLDRWEHRRER